MKFTWWKQKFGLDAAFLEKCPVTQCMVPGPKSSQSYPGGPQPSRCSGNKNDCTVFKRKRFLCGFLDQHTSKDSKQKLKHHQITNLMLWRKQLKQHLHNFVDEIFMFLRYMWRAFGGWWGDEGWCPYTISMLIPPLLCLLSQLGFLFLI